MRFARRILVILGISTAPAMATSIGCNGDVVMHTDSASSSTTGAGSTSTGGATGSGSTTSSSGATVGAAQSLCDCAAELVGGVATCVACDEASCPADYVSCGTCASATECVVACAGDGPCIAACIRANPGYAAFVECVFLSCAASCAPPLPLDCPLADGGADASAD